MRDVYDVRVYLAPPEDLRRRWKVQRDCSRRGYTTDEVLAELDRREPDAEVHIRPQQRYADIVISFMPGDRGDQEHLDAKITMRPGLVHPDLSSLVDGDANSITLDDRQSETSLWVPGTIDQARSAAIQEAVWDRMHFASHLRTERLGEFTVGTELHRSQSLAITQLLVLYQLVTARAAVAVGATDARDRTASRPRAGYSFPAAASIERRRGAWRFRWMRRRSAIHAVMSGYERSRAVAAAQAIIDQGGWCVLEVCVDVPSQRWEARVLIFDLTAEAVADTVADEIMYEPERDARLSGCDRRTLRPDPAMGAHLCYVAEHPAPASSAAPANGPPSNN